MSGAWSATSGLLAIAGAALLWLGVRMKVTSPSLEKNVFQPPPDSLPLVSGRDLLQRHGALVHSIRNKSGLSNANLEADLMPVLLAYAEFVQLLPASEAHHHAQPGGLLQHTLEVVDHALTYRRRYMLPLNAEAERINKLSAVWTFGVAMAALFHDIGKAMADMRITLFGDGMPQAGRAWQPMAGNMLEQRGQFYRVEFNAARAYGDHTQLGVMLMQRVVPARALTWISEQDQSLLTQMLDVLSNPQCDNVIKQIIKKADSESTRLNLLSGPKSRFKTARETPLIELLDSGLERLLSSGQLRLNVPGGHGFVWHSGDGYGDLLLVVPRVADALREHLQGALSEGSRGIPSDNLTLYGTLQDYGRIRPTDSGKAVWRVVVEGIPKSLTVLRFARGSATFKSLSDWPAPFEGDITVAAASTTDDGQDIEARAPTSSLVPSGDLSEVEAPKAELSDEAKQVEKPFWIDDDGDPPPINPHPGAELSIPGARAAEREAVESARSMGGLLPPDEVPALVTQQPSQALEPQTAARIPARKGGVPAMKDPTRQAPLNEALEAFEDWLRIGLKSGHVRYNDGRAALHFHKPSESDVVALLITPAIYQRYVKERDPDKWSTTEAAKIPREAWVPLQSALLKSHPHKTLQDGKIKRTVFKYATKGAGIFQANVLTDPLHLFQDVPEPNPYISGEVSPSDMVALLTKA